MNSLVKVVQKSGAYTIASRGPDRTATSLGTEGSEFLAAGESYVHGADHLGDKLLPGFAEFGTR